LSVAQRLELFRAVCAAVQYAHRNLVVHRDIKPGNILVTADGQPKLLDFGIARMLSPEPAQAVTMAEHRVMTPEYASPEQIKGEAITTASDVYSLGVVLFELLTLRRPYLPEPKTRLDLEKMICDSPPQRPSTLVRRASADQSRDALPTGPADSQDKEATAWPEGNATRLARKLRGDLDTILLKALRKRPEERYTSVEQFSEDIARHLQRLPVIARPPTWSYLGRRFVRRHAAGVSAAGVAVIAVLTGLTISVVAWSQAEAARERETAQRQVADQHREAAEQARTLAETEADRARAINEFLQQMLITDDPQLKLRNNITLRELLDEAAKIVEAGRFAAHPESEAAVRTTLGRTYTYLKFADRGEPHLRRALQLRRDLLSPELDIAESAATLAFALIELGKNDESVALLREALEIRRRLLGNDDRSVVRTSWAISTALRDTAQYEQAEIEARQALDITMRRNGPEHLDTADSLFRLGWILSAGRRTFAESERLLRESLRLRQVLLGPDHPQAAEAMLRLGNLLSRKGDATEAEAMLRAAADLQRRVLGPEHPLTLRVLGNLAKHLTRVRKLDEADAVYRELCEARRAYFGDAVGSVSVLPDWAALKFEMGDHAAAEEMMREAIAKLREAAPAHDALLLNTMLAFSDMLVRQQRFAEAEPLLLEHQANLEALGPGAPAEQTAVRRLITLYEAWHGFDPTACRPQMAAEWRARLAPTVAQPAGDEAP
jgi:tetratricopeptide (TPR) repeat protein